MEEFQVQTRKFSFAKSVRDTTAMLASQLEIINGEGLSSLYQVENKLSEIEKCIADTQSQINKLEADKNSANEIISAAEQYFRKYSVFKKSAEYPKFKRQEDKTLLAEYEIKSLDDIAKFRENMQEYPERITALQTQINEIKKKEDDYKSIINTYKNCSEDDYISRLVKAAREKMDRQETAKLKALQEESYEVYFPENGVSLSFSQLIESPNIDDYYEYASGKWFDIEGTELSDKLENIYQKTSAAVGAVIVLNIGGKRISYYVDDVGFRFVENFTVSKSEQLRQKKLHEEKQKLTAAKKRSR